MKTFNGSPAVAAGMITPDMARELAVEQRVCVRPLLRRVIDQATGAEIRSRSPAGRPANPSARPAPTRPAGCGCSNAPKAGTATDEPETGRR